MGTLELEARLDNLLATAQAETADIDIFAPIAEREECPICLIPLPIKDYEAVFSTCCGKHICNGCAYKHALAEKEKAYDDPDKRLGLCAFCRQPYAPKDSIKRLRKLMKKNIPGAFMSMAIHYQSGDGVLQSYTRSLEMYIRAAEIGHANAYTNIGKFYEAGLVVEQSVNKAVEFYEIAAKKGYYLAHRLLAKFHVRNYDFERCIKHSQVAASAGDQVSMDCVLASYKDNSISKEDLTQTLRAHQASINGTKSKERDEGTNVINSLN